MNTTAPDRTRKVIGRLLGLIVIAGAIVASLMVVYDTDKQPRTDDASVRANFIAIAPEVGGRLVKLPVKDNAFVKKGDLLFEIDPRDYQYALQAGAVRSEQPGTTDYRYAKKNCGGEQRR